MKSCQEVFCPIQNAFVNLSTWRSSCHSLVPNENNNQDIFNSHFLKLTKQLLTASFFASILVTFCYKTFVISFSLIWRLRHPICEYGCFAVLNLSALFEIANTEVNMVLILNSSRVGLILYFLNSFLLSETDTVEHRLHFIDFSFNIFRLRQIRIIRNNVL